MKWLAMLQYNYTLTFHFNPDIGEKSRLIKGVGIDADEHLAGVSYKATRRDYRSDL